MVEKAAASKIDRYRQQSLRLLDGALNELRGGRWMRSEDLLWGSLTLAVKGVALSQGDTLEDDEAVFRKLTYIRPAARCKTCGWRLAAKASVWVGSASSSCLNCGRFSEYHRT